MITPPKNHIRVLDNGMGWVGLLDHMGDQTTIVNAARISFQNVKEVFDERDQKLLKYLIENQHTTPLEHVTFTFSVHCPLYIRSQWMRHRCLAGDTQIWFNLPTKNRFYKMTIKEIYDKWNHTTKNKVKCKQGDGEYRKHLIQKMNIRSLDEETKKIFNNKIKNVFFNGIKDVYQMTLANGRTIKCTKDHQIMTESGWKELQNISIGQNIGINGITNNKQIIEKPYFFDYQGEIQDEVWKEYGGKYLVSSYGRIKNTLNTRNQPLKEPKFKKKTIGKNGYPCVVMSFNGKQRTTTIHTLMAEVFGLKGECIRHLDDNKLNCKLDNLCGGTLKDNAQDSIKNGGKSFGGYNFSEVTNIEYIGREQVYDLEVDTNNHNFIANGIVVHNCASYNEVSRRYTQDEIEFYIPNDLRKQSDSNRQASINELVDDNYDVVMAYKKVCDDAYKTYLDLLAKGVCREQARGVLPQAMMTTFWYTVNLHSLLHFIELREDNHAQKEIQEYAIAMKELIKPFVPHVIEAFENRKK